jgi:hydroxyethylthiazole kinase-like uncharacterized protein yjeF
MPAPPISLYTVAEIRAADRAAGAALHDGTLARAAGRAIADLAWTGWCRGLVNPKVLVLVGPGNNGADALFAARALLDRGVRVTVVEPLGVNGSPLQRQARAELPASATRIPVLPDASFRADLIIDGLLGLGARPVTDGPLAEVIEQANASGRPILAIDLPSGLNADTGALETGQRCIHATQTLTLIGHKRGLYTFHGAAAAGAVHVETLGLAPQASSCHLDELTSVTALSPRDSLYAHKGSRGDAWVLGGSAGMTGAAWMAARAALATGAGRVFAALERGDSAAYPPWAAQVQVRDWSAQVQERAALVVGCGLGATDAAHGLLARSLQHGGPLVLDADALTLLAQRSTLIPMLAQRTMPAVLTPHPLEAARLLAMPVSAVQADRFAAARELADRFGAVVLLKGNGTVIAAQQSDALWVTGSGHPILATGGTGDCLAGLIGGLLARGLAPAHATRLGAWIHGSAAQKEAARLGGSNGLDIGALCDACARQLNAMADGRPS